ncbi:MAG: diacylglycerol kinase family protein [Candidatus Margulisbacteria bacterium]|nr:diacylglycerol kinase family protein [Candidatus Margulisiibacteriota bacterium]
MPKKFIQSFRYARLGAAHSLQTERNILIHFVIGLLVLALAVYLKVSPVELAVIVLTITLVIVAEMINTAIEEAVDLVKPERHPLAALAKNIAAGAVLTAAIGSIAVGLLIFIPRLMR